VNRVLHEVRSMLADAAFDTSVPLFCRRVNQPAVSVVASKRYNDSPVQLGFGQRILTPMILSAWR